MPRRHDPSKKCRSRAIVVHVIDGRHKTHFDLAIDMALKRAATRNHIHPGRIDIARLDDLSRIAATPFSAIDAVIAPRVLHVDLADRLRPSCPMFDINWLSCKANRGYRVYAGMPVPRHGFPGGGHGSIDQSGEIRFAGFQGAESWPWNNTRTVMRGVEQAFGPQSPTAGVSPSGRIADGSIMDEVELLGAELAYAARCFRDAVKDMVDEAIEQQLEDEAITEAVHEMMVEEDMEWEEQKSREQTKNWLEEQFNDWLQEAIDEDRAEGQEQEEKQKEQEEKKQEQAREGEDSEQKEEDDEEDDGEGEQEDQDKTPDNKQDQLDIQGADLLLLLKDMYERTRLADFWQAMVEGRVPPERTDERKEFLNWIGQQGLAEHNRSVWERIEAGMPMIGDDTPYAMLYWVYLECSAAASAIESRRLQMFLMKRGYVDPIRRISQILGDVDHGRLTVLFR